MSRKLNIALATGSVLVVSGVVFVGGLSCASRPSAPPDEVGALSRLSCPQTASSLVGFWTSERDDDEFAGRCVYEFRSDGVVHMYEYETKDTAQFATNGPCGFFAPVNELVQVCWNTAFGLKLATYRVTMEDGAFVLTDVENGRSERFAKTPHPVISRKRNAD